MRVKFTAERVASFRCPPDKVQAFLWDTEVPGFGLKASRGGARKYIVEGRLPSGKTLRITLGDSRTWALESYFERDAATGKMVEKRRGARPEARRLRALIDQGIDPRQEQARQRADASAAVVAARRRQLTVGDVWPVYLEARRAKWSAGHYANHINLAAPGGQPKKRGSGLKTAGPLYPLMSRRLSELTPAAIAAWLEAEAATRPTNAAQSFRILRAFINWLADTDEYKNIVPGAAYSTRAVKDALPKGRAKEGDCLQREQLAIWFGAVRRIGNPVISAYLQALLLTGARREEMAGLRWEDVDFTWRTMTIRDKAESQGGQEGWRTIPLPPYLAGLLAALPRANNWVFSSRTAAAGRLAEPRIAHTKALAAAGLPHVSLHGLRRSFTTLSEWVEVPIGVVAQIQGHKPSALAERHYHRRPIDLLRKWHDRIEAWVLEEAGIGSIPTPPNLHVVTAV